MFAALLWACEGGVLIPDEVSDTDDSDFDSDSDAVSDSDAAPDTSLFDAHIHQMPGVTDQALLDLATGAGLAGITVLGVSDTTDFQAAHPDFVRSFAPLPRDPTAGGPALDAFGLDAIEAQVQAGAVGIGELAIWHFAAPDSPGGHYPADHPVLLEIYDLAAANGIPVNVHIDGEAWETYPSGIPELEKALSYNPATKFIWAHSGDVGPDVLRPLLAEYDNLFLDVSCRNPYYGRPFDPEITRMDDDGVLKPGWKALFEDFPGRAMFGSDIGPPGREELLAPDVVPYYEAMFAQLEDDARAAVSNGNARRLFGAR